MTRLERYLRKKQSQAAYKDSRIVIVMSKNKKMVHSSETQTEEVPSEPGAYNFRKIDKQERLKDRTQQKDLVSM